MYVRNGYVILFRFLACAAFSEEVNKLYSNLGKTKC